MPETDQNLLKKVRKTASWRQNARFERMGLPGDLLNNVRSALKYLGYDRILMPLEFEKTAGRLFNLIRADRAKEGGRTRSKQARARKRKLAEPTLF